MNAKSTKLYHEIAAYSPPSHRVTVIPAAADVEDVEAKATKRLRHPGVRDAIHVPRSRCRHRQNQRERSGVCTGSRRSDPPRLGLARGIQTQSARRKQPRCGNFERALQTKAERTGFEPADQFPGHRFSKPALSTTQPPLRLWFSRVLGHSWPTCRFGS